ncbi:MAG: hypothetical protein KF817_09465 [Phycisphaeraceae bacterium]|nr:hypothetical protein [Phycisphaeraceae bacterium]
MRGSEIILSWLIGALLLYIGFRLGPGTRAADGTPVPLFVTFVQAVRVSGVLVILVGLSWLVRPRQAMRIRGLVRLAMGAGFLGIAVWDLLDAGRSLVIPWALLAIGAAIVLVTGIGDLAAGRRQLDTGGGRGARPGAPDRTTEAPGGEARG